MASNPENMAPARAGNVDRATVLAAFSIGTGASAGFTLLPVTLPALAQAFKLTAGQVGLVGTLELLGVTVGALMAGFAARRISTRPLAVSVLGILFLSTLAMMRVHDIVLLAALRAVSGSMAGFSLGLAYSVLSKTRQPDRNFAIMSVFPLIYGAACFPLVRSMEGMSGWYAPFIVLTVTAGLALIASFWLNGRLHHDGAGLTFAESLPDAAGVIGLTSVVLYYAGICAIYAFAYGIGVKMTGSSAMAGLALSSSQVTGILGCLCAAYLAGRIARTVAVGIGFAATLGGIAFLIFVPGTASLFIALIAVDFGWNFLAGSHIGAVGDMDERGSAAAFLAVAINGGAALGPLLGFLVRGDIYAPLEASAALLITLSFVMIMVALRLKRLGLERRELSREALELPSEWHSGRDAGMWAVGQEDTAGGPARLVLN